MDAGVMVDYHTQKKIIFFFLRVIIYHNTLIQGQYIYNIKAIPVFRTRSCSSGTHQ
jgi:hypothetical protein